MTMIFSGSQAFIVKVSLRAIPELMMSFLIRRYCIVYCVGSWFLYSAHPCQDLTVKILTLDLSVPHLVFRSFLL